ncbi:hypothetical protein VTL71DRAFT_13847 [Oculimacula yallundae]|uniref:Uncharacterized protein n=1 Tax=Oculimacula yallundae TaxID=86028 RepID=A0ABR4CN56_9HELO
MFNCPDCDKRYTKQTSLNRHMQNHVKSKQYTCPTCHVSFYRRDLLLRHSKMHTADSDTSTSATGAVSTTPGRAAVRERGNQGRLRCHTACVRCRESRTKCDGSRPCLSCATSGKTCEYSNAISRISRAPLHIRNIPSEMQSEQTASGGALDNEDHDEDMGRDQQWNNPRYSSQHSQISIAPNDSNTMLLSPLSSSEAPSFAFDSHLHQHHADSLSQFQDDSTNQADSSLPALIMDPLVSDLAMDTMAWPWLHESMFLQVDYSEPWPNFDEHGIVGANTVTLDGPLGNTSDEASTIPVDGHHSFHSANPTTASSRSASTWNTREHVPISNTHDYSSSISSTLDRTSELDTPQPESSAVAQSRIVDEIVTRAVELGSSRATKSSRSSHWQTEAIEVQSSFKLHHDLTQNSSHALQIFIDLYLQHFGPLWPLVSLQNLDSDLLHPLLYLTLVSIGAMYGSNQSAQLGTLIHCRLRQVLTTSLDFGAPDEDLVWLGQARLLTQVNALYFGQSQAFSYAQHLGGILVAQARRMNLFRAQRYRSDESGSESQRTTSERLARWLYIEARRRLAFGIFRAETYTSVLLNTRPLVSPEEIDLALPYADSIWRGGKLPPEVYLAMVERDEASRHKQRFSDVVRIAFERDETPSSLDPQGNELLLFGLQQSVWKFSHDHDVFARLTGCMRSSSQLGYDGLNGVAASSEVSCDSRSTATNRSTETPLISIMEDHLSGSPKRMQDLKTDLDRLTSALQRWKESLKVIRNGIILQQDRNGVLSSLLLYHLSFIRLQAPVEDMHSISYRTGDKRPVEKQIIQDMCEWANGCSAGIAVQHVCIIWSLIILEMRRPEGTRAKFNFLAFAGLHHAAVVLWTFMGASSEVDGQNSYLLEAFAESKPKIEISKNNSKEIMLLFSQVFTLVGPGRWSSFGAAAAKLSDYEFPSCNE